ncbi:MAG: ROK family protein [Bacteroidota bacterium]
MSRTPASTSSVGERTFFVVVDIGGTNLRCALVPTDAPTTLLARSEAQTPATSGAVVDLIAHMAEDGAQQLGVPTHSLVGLGCVSPGILDPASGVVSTAVNLGWTDVPLRAMLAERTGLPVAIENDVNAGAIAEYHFSELQRVHSLVYLTVSTGLACGIVLDGRVYHGASNAAGELGFLATDLHALDDPNRSLEHVASGAGVARAWAHQGESHLNRNAQAITAAEVFDAARDGNAGARHLVHEAAAGVALAAAAICCVLNPEVLVLGGSIAEHEPAVVDRVQTHLQAMLPFPPRIEQARLGKDAPLLGAVAVAERLALAAAA